MVKTNYKSIAMLFLTALIFGTTFVAQQQGMDYIGPFTYITARSVIGAIFLFISALLFDKADKGSTDFSFRNSLKRFQNKNLVVGGVLCGIVMFTATSFQQVGLMYTTVGKAGFLTSLYIVIVPIFGLIFRKKVHKIIWFCVAIAVVGMYFLCMTDDFSISIGDFLVFMCAVMFSVHFMLLDKYSPIVDCVRMSCIQFVVCGLISLVTSVMFETITLEGIIAAWFPIMYAGVFSSGIAFTLQSLAQRDTSPFVASLIVSLESVVSVLAGFVLLGETLTTREITGCVLIFVAIIFAQVPDYLNSKKLNNKG